MCWVRTCILHFERGYLSTHVANKHEFVNTICNAFFLYIYPLSTSEFPLICSHYTLSSVNAIRAANIWIPNNAPLLAAFVWAWFHIFLSVCYHFAVWLNRMFIKVIDGDFIRQVTFCWCYVVLKNEHVA